MSVRTKSFRFLTALTALIIVSVGLGHAYLKNSTLPIIPPVSPDDFLIHPEDTIPKPQRDTTRGEEPEPLDPHTEDRHGDPFSAFEPTSPLRLLDFPSDRDLKIELDSAGEFYTIYERVGLSDYRPVSVISVQDFQRWKFARMRKDYWEERGRAADGESPTTSKNLLPPVELPAFISRITGGDLIEINPNGSVLLDFGGKWQRIDNPQIPVRQQRNGGFNFDQRIQMNLNGKIGEKINLNTNWDTKASFQFENMFNQGYSGYEEDIIQQVQFGNVSMPVTNSLINGAQNLFGVSSRLRFGKLWVNSVFSNQRGTVETIRIRNGAQTKDFELRADEYEDNRHFFLGHFFRNNYEQALRSTPVITSGVMITRVEVYVTNRANDTQTLRNFSAFMDLGEGVPGSPDNPAVGMGNGGAARNNANDLYATITGDPVLRSSDQVGNTLENAYRLRKGADYEVLRGARKLDPTEYNFHPQLGYVSLVQPLRNDEILAVSYEYTYNGEVHKVGEMTEDYQSFDDDQVIFLKMLSPSTIRVDLPMWDLMMKNVYSLQATQLERENFQFRVIYRDDLTGIDNPSLHEGARTKDIPLVQLMNLDRLNPNNDPQRDGNFDFIEGITIDPQNARIIFPVLEPFGDHLEGFFDPNAELQLIDKYIFDELYDGTRADAVLFSNKSKFFLKGSYQAGSNNEIMLPGINISEGSVSVRAGGNMLMEGSDYTVDYQFGRVRILNDGVMNSGKEIVIQYERADLFNFQVRNLMGLDLEYRFNDDLSVTTTLLHLNERPVISRISMGNEPVRNTVWGASVNYRKESGFLTRMIDKIPLLDTKEMSNFTINGEFAQIVPGTNRLIGRDGGTAYVDDFESAEIPYDLGRLPQTWMLGSTPSTILPVGGVGADTLAYAYRRGRLAWYNVDNTAFFNRGIGQAPPDNISEADRENHYSRLIGFDEIFQGRDPQQVNNPERPFDLAFFPDEPGSYNYNPELDRNGFLPSPAQNFGAITKAITYDIDFDNINVQYIEFWMLDPFISGANGQIVRRVGDRNVGTNNTTGGRLLFNLGNVSEDVIPDSRHGFENGLPVTDAEQDNIVITPWGRVTTEQYLTDAFSTEDGAREAQDVGLDGMNNQQEQEFFRDYLNAIQARVSPDIFERIEDDPSRDDFEYYLGGQQDSEDLKIFDRYKSFNNTEGNSPENAGTASNSFLPDNEDLNRDNTITDLEAYYEYQVDLQPGRLDDSRYVVDKVTATAPNGEQVDWYQFRIPIREFDRAVGGINGFKSVRFLRTYLTGWQQPVVLRMVNFQFVGGQWRPYFSGIQEPGFNNPIEPYDPSFIVSSVNIEENGQAPTGETPYVVPPGFQRDQDPTSITNARLNEQSIQLCVEGLQDTDSRAAFKNTTFDFINYKRLKMFIHAESDDALDNEMAAYVRLGTDFEQNYYEIQIPLKLTTRGATDPFDIWPEENNLDIAFQDLLLTKTERNRNGLSKAVPFSRESEDGYKFTVVGNPDLSNVQVIMLGVRNPQSPDELPKSVCVWMNEMRVSGFNKDDGWAANLRMNAKLADLATVSAALRYSTPWFGGIQDRLGDRSRETSLYYDVSSNIQLDKIFLNRLGISLPMYVGYERSITTPYFDPLDPDILLDTSVETRDPGYLDLVRDETTRRSINFTNVRKSKVKEGAKTFLWDIENFALTAAYSDTRTSNIRTAEYLMTDSRLNLTYGYNFSGKPFEPFKKMKLLNSPYLKWLQDFNLNYLPNSIAVSGTLNRRYTKTQLRSSDLSTNGILPMFEKYFMFDRVYSMNWNLTRNLTVDYNATANAIIDEPEGEINTRVKRDSIMTNLARLGRMKFYNQTTNINYRLPLDKFPFLNWLNADARYNAGYTWTAGAVGIADTLGNTIRNQSTASLNGQVNLQKIYEKSRYLAQVTNPRLRKNPPLPAQSKKKRLQLKLQRIAKKKDKAKGKRDKRKGKLKNKITKEKLKDINTDSLAVAPEVEISDSVYNEITEKYDKRIEKLDKREAKTKSGLNGVNSRQRAARNSGGYQNNATTAVLSTLLSVKKINFNYSVNSGTVVPGFLPVPKYFGLADGFGAPGAGFALGGQSRALIDNMIANEWLTQSAAQNYQLMQNRTQNLSFRTTIEPAKQFRIEVDAKRTNSDNYSEVIRHNGLQYVSETPSRNGSYSISFITLGTAFRGDDANNNSSVFDDFIRNRNQMKDILDIRNTAGEYDPNAQDVLIPAFVAAYRGRGVNGSSGSFPEIPLPNWRVTYTGLSKLEFFKDIFRTVSLTHSYSSTYNVGGFTSSLLYDPRFVNLDVSVYDLALPIADPETGSLIPILVMNQVSITERFSPLIGIDFRTINDVTFKLSFGKQRNVMLNLSNAQVTEMKSNDVAVDLGLKKKGITLPINGGITLPNDLDFRVALTVRDTRTLQRKITDEGEQNSTATAGNTNFQVRPTLSYVVNKRITLTGYFDRQVNTPRISNSFKRANTAFGMQVRFNLAP